MIRATLDANVLVSGLASSTGAPGILLERWVDLEFEMILSEHVLNSVARAWRKPYFQHRYGPHRSQDFLRVLRANATIVTPAMGVHGVAADEEDDLVLATALAGGAHVLVTGDNYLRALGAYEEIAILTPREFLDRLDIAPS
ncbi:MAG: putative toxin-antitoxin system toxin component, PIN family [Thermomicrobiales bacterium]|nr:putative toxin-antitoxin system toxin component, PIN family [Thermomicrobiales bacterium]